MALWLRIAVLCELLLRECQNGFFDSEAEELMSFVSLCTVPVLYSEPGELRTGRLQ